jgi:4-carboxymuconolactone decarboxylase
MRISRLTFLMSSAMALHAQSDKLPADVLSDSYSRLPPVKRAELDDKGKLIFDRVAGANRAASAPGPAGLSLYSPVFAEPMHAINEYLRESVVGRRYFELSALVAAREFDQQYEWTGHEIAGLRAGLDQSVIDVVKFNKDVAGLPEKESTVIRVGREIFRQHRVSPEVFAKAVDLFGRQGAVEISAIMGDYAMAAVILTFADQHLPPDRKPLMPAR